jgi:hypothetical protein
MAFDDRISPKTPFRPMTANDWAGPATDFEPMERLQVTKQFSVGNEPAAPSTDWTSLGGAGITAAGQTVGALAQVAGQKAAMDQAMASSSANRVLSEKLAKMQLAANQEQFGREQNLRALLWALNANKGQISNTAASRDVRRGAIEGMDQLLTKVMLKRG